MKLFSKSDKNNNLSKFQELNSGSDKSITPGHAPGLRDLYSPQKTQQEHVLDISDILVEMGLLSPEQIQPLHREKRRISSIDIEHFAIRAGVSLEDVLKAKARLYGFEFCNINPTEVDKQALGKLDLSYIRSNHVLPVRIEDGILVVATSEPANVFAIDDLKRQTGLDVKILVCSRKDINTVCDEFDDNKFSCDVDEIIGDMADIEVVNDIEEEIEDLERSAAESPVIKYVNYILTKAIHEQASDVHIEPKQKYTRIRYRIDGALFDSMQAPAKMHLAIVSRIKIMSDLDISERRVPQDGKIAVIMGGRGIDLRVSILPTSNGEKVVIRILDSNSITIGMDKLGMEDDLLKLFAEQIALPHGIFLVTGPTGSGKSTTLYSALGQMNGDKMNISTVEDPVEYNLEFCNQVQVNEKTGLTFSASLRSLLRQDPDIIMVGEIRDNETARIAVQAALTGHLVLSTLHTNDAPSSISRLVDIGVAPYLIAASLNGVLAQRLVRNICSNCKEVYRIGDNMVKYAESNGIDPKLLTHGAGCEQCRGTGYVGRAGIFELLVVDDDLKDVINSDSSASCMKQAFAESKQTSMFEDGIAKVKQGITTIEEVLRVTQVYEQSKENDFAKSV